MLFQSRVFQLAKDVGHPAECQDACAVDAAAGIAVIADGVASAIFSRQWAEILTRAIVSGMSGADAPKPADPEAFRQWLVERRQQWTAEIDTTDLAWFQKAKLPMGAFSTLLWVRVEAETPGPGEEQQEGTFGAYRLRGYAIGDSCLFHVRRGELVRTFPIQKADELEADPVVLGSVDLNRDQLMEFAALDELCYPDDVLVLCTDAVAEWALRRTESGNPPAWDGYWDMTRQRWEQEISELRDQRQMRFDDATLLLLRVTEPGVELDQPEFPQLEVTQTQSHKPAEEDWKEKLRSALGEFPGQVADQVEKASGRIEKAVVRGWQKWKKKAVEKYREKFGSDDE